MANLNPPRPGWDPNRPAAAGWQRRCVASEPRLSEAVEMYRELGLEVLLVPVSEECAAEGKAGVCTACFGAAAEPDRHRVIYTRLTGGGKEELEELF